MSFHSTQIRIYLVASFVLLCNFVFAQQETIGEMSWSYQPGQMAIDADLLRRDFDVAGLTAELLIQDGNLFEISGFADCAEFEKGLENIADQRAAYISNFLTTQFGIDDSRKNITANFEKNCSGVNARPENRKLILKIVKVNTEVAVEILPEAEPPSALSKMSELNIGETLVLEGLNFQPGKHQILNEAKPVLKKLLAIMQENPTLQIEIQGHVCCGKKPTEDGLDEQTGKMNLSVTRAEFVYDYLIKNGIDPSRLAFKGFAMTKPLVYPEITIQDQITNRRVEVMVTGK